MKLEFLVGQFAIILIRQQIKKSPYLSTFTLQEDETFRARSLLIKNALHLAITMHERPTTCLRPFAPFVSDSVFHQNKKETSPACNIMLLLFSRVSFCTTVSIIRLSITMCFRFPFTEPTISASLRTNHVCARTGEV